MEPILINSALVSAQQRKRLYWTNIPGVAQPADKGILLKDVLDTGVSPRDKAYCLDANYFRHGESANSIKYSLERSRRQIIFEPLCASLYRGTVQKEKSMAVGTTNNLTGKMAQVVVAPIKLGFLCGKDYQQNRVYSVRGKSVSLNRSGGGWGANTRMYKIDLPDGDYFIRKLTPTECERLQTWPEGYTGGVSPTQRYKMLGNGWTADVVAHIFNFIPREDL